MRIAIQQVLQPSIFQKLKEAPSSKPVSQALDSRMQKLAFNKNQLAMVSLGAYVTNSQNFWENLTNGFSPKADWLGRGIYLSHHFDYAVSLAAENTRTSYPGQLPMICICAIILGSINPLFQSTGNSEYNPEGFDSSCAIIRNNMKFPNADEIVLTSQNQLIPLFLITPKIQGSLFPQYLNPAPNQYPNPAPNQYPNPAQAQYLNPAQAQYLNPAQAQYLNPAQAQYLNPAQAQYLNPTQAQYLNPAQAQYLNPTPNQYPNPAQAQYLNPAPNQYSNPAQAQYLNPAPNQYPNPAQAQYLNPAPNQHSNPAQAQYPNPAQPKAQLNDSQPTQPEQATNLPTSAAETASLAEPIMKSPPTPTPASPKTSPDFKKFLAMEPEEIIEFFISKDLKFNKKTQEIIIDQYLNGEALSGTSREKLESFGIPSGFAVGMLNRIPKS